MSDQPIKYFDETIERMVAPGWNLFGYDGAHHLMAKEIQAHRASIVRLAGLVLRLEVHSADYRKVGDPAPFIAQEIRDCLESKP